MSLEEDSQKDAEDICKLGLAVAKSAVYQARYTTYMRLEGLLNKEEYRVKRDESKEKLRESLRESKKILDHLPINYPI